MIKRRHARNEELMLVPFLDILCSLIGVLVLVIVVLCVSQASKIQGRTPEEIKMATEAQKMKKEMELNKKINAELIAKVDKLKKLQEEMQQKEAQMVKLRKLLTTTTEDKAKNEELSQTLLKELDNLLIEINGLNPQEAPLKAEIARLMAEIKKRQPPEQKGPPVIVQPGGSGLAKGSKVFFVEASGGRLVFYWNEKDKGTVSAAPDVVAVDVAYNAFLQGVQSVPNSKILFLLRDDGMGAYNNGAGWAMGPTHGFKSDRIGKLPIPGRGVIDMKMFKEFLGALTPPPQALSTPAAATPAPAAPKPPAPKPPAPKPAATPATVTPPKP